MKDSEVKPILAYLDEMGIVISPGLAYVDSGIEFDEDVFEYINDYARDYSRIIWNDTFTIHTFDALPMPPRMPSTAFYETATSTTAYDTYQHGGGKFVCMNIAHQVIKKLERCIDEIGFDKFVAAYALVTNFENYLAMDFYGSMKENDFLYGKKHRPWIGYTLHDELILIHQSELVSIYVEDGVRYIRLTSKGKQRLAELTELLQDIGYIEKRIQLLKVSHFSEMTDYEEVINHIGPTSNEYRHRLLQLGQIKPNSRVLDLGCGSGVLAFNCGLADLMGPDGQLTCLDAAPGMIRRAIEKAEVEQKPWVTFVQGSAEHLPFENHTFDHVISAYCLHLTRISDAINEIHRTLKPGGTLCAIFPLKFPIRVPFLEKWFQPLYARIGAPTQDTSLPDVDDVSNAMRDRFNILEKPTVMLPSVYDKPEMVVRFFVESVGVFNRELSKFPWQERQDILSQLKENGQTICSAMDKDELTVDYPCQMILARSK